MTATLLSVAIGGALGAVARLTVLRWTTRPTQPDSDSLWDGPARATLLANLVGCLALGLYLGTDASGPVWLDALTVTGLCGGLTTFSTLIGDLTRLADQARRLAAFGYLAASFGFGALALWLGTHLGQIFSL